MSLLGDYQNVGAIKRATLTLACAISGAYKRPGTVMASKLKGYVRWLPATLVGAVVVLAGARLIALSVHERVAQIALSAQDAVARHTRLIETQLQTLADRTRSEARRAVSALGDGTRAVPLASVLPGRNTFWMTATGTVLRARDADAAVSRALASEWASAPAAKHAAAGLFGPVRYGSEWFVVAQVPIEPQSTTGWAASGARCVGFETLDALLAQARFGLLVNEGYDFELSQLDPLTHQLREFLSSRPDTLIETLTSAIRAPAALSPASPSAYYLQLGVRPRTGWYPAPELATDIVVLIVVAWALAFGAHDLTGSLSRTRTALAATRKRLHAVNEQLVARIQEHQDLKKSLEHARYHDLFSGLPNRRYFMDQLDHVLHELRTRRRQRIAIFLIEIHRFELINDTLGRSAGDELMLQAAERFAAALGGMECVLVHWEGGQLALLAYHVDSAESAHAIATRLQDSHQEPFSLRRHRIRIASRIGFACIDSGLQRTEEALREADIALSVAKQQQSPLAVEYTPGLGGAVVSSVSLEADLHIALDRRQFQLLFQPIVDLRGRRVVGVESLLRWRHPVEGLLAPGKFLAIAEEAGLMVPVTRWVIQRVCRLAAEWRLRLPRGADFYLSVNLSAAVLRDRGLRDYVAHVLQDTGTPPGNLKLELTEGGLIGSLSTARDVLVGLHSLGVELMLDNFGTGYSSLSCLQLFPFDYVKIDRPAVNWTGSERATHAITSGILLMASGLGLRTVAEAVETQEAAQALLHMGCDFAQGNFFSEPLEAEDALQQLREHGSQTTVVPMVRAAEGERGRGETITVEDSPTLVLSEMDLEGTSSDDAAAP